MIPAPMTPMLGVDVMAPKIESASCEVVMEASALRGDLMRVAALPIKAAL